MKNTQIILTNLKLFIKSGVRNRVTSIPRHTVTITVVVYYVVCSHNFCQAGERRLGKRMLLKKY